MDTFSYLLFVCSILYPLSFARGEFETGSGAYLPRSISLLLPIPLCLIV